MHVCALYHSLPHISIDLTTTPLSVRYPRNIRMSSLHRTVGHKERTISYPISRTKSEASRVIIISMGEFNKKIRVLGELETFIKARAPISKLQAPSSNQFLDSTLAIMARSSSTKPLGRPPNPKHLPQFPTTTALDASRALSCTFHVRTVLSEKPFDVRR